MRSIVMKVYSSYRPRSIKGLKGSLFVNRTIVMGETKGKEKLNVLTSYSPLTNP